MSDLPESLLENDSTAEFHAGEYVEIWTGDRWAKAQITMRLYEVRFDDDGDAEALDVIEPCRIRKSDTVEKQSK